MKKEYTNPEMIITSFEAKDIITVSALTTTQDINLTLTYSTYLHS